MAAISAAPSAYSDITDPEFLGYDKSAQDVWGQVAAKQADLSSLQKKLANAKRMFYNTGGGGEPDQWAAYITNLEALIGRAANEMHSLQGQARTFETQRENRGAVLAQGGVNTQVAGAGAEAIKSENLLAQNIGQEITGRIARNTQQAREAMSSVNLLGEAARGQAAARAGQAGYAAGSGTGGAMAEAATAKSDADKAAIEGYRIGAQNLLMGQGEAAAKAAESLTGTISQQTTDWAAKSTAAVSDVTGNLLTNVKQVAATRGFSGDIQTPGVKASEAAVGTTLGTWSFKSYLDVLDTLTSHSANKSTWDQMLLEQGQPVDNPYAQFDTAITPLTPIAGTQSNLLAAAAGADNLDNVYTLSGAKKKAGNLI